MPSKRHKPKRPKRSKYVAGETDSDSLTKPLRGPSLSSDCAGLFNGHVSAGDMSHVSCEEQCQRFRYDGVILHSPQDGKVAFEIKQWLTQNLSLPYGQSSHPPQIELFGNIPIKCSSVARSLEIACVSSQNIIILCTKRYKDDYVLQQAADGIWSLKTVHELNLISLLYEYQDDMLPPNHIPVWDTNPARYEPDCEHFKDSMQKRLSFSLDKRLAHDHRRRNCERRRKELTEQHLSADLSGQLAKELNIRKENDSDTTDQLESKSMSLDSAYDSNIASQMSSMSLTTDGQLAEVPWQATGIQSSPVQNNLLEPRGLQAANSSTQVTEMTPRNCSGDKSVSMHSPSSSPDLLSSHSLSTVTDSPGRLQCNLLIGSSASGHSQTLSSAPLSIVTNCTIKMSGDRNLDYLTQEEALLMVPRAQFNGTNEAAPTEINEYPECTNILDLETDFGEAATSRPVILATVVQDATYTEPCRERTERISHRPSSSSSCSFSSNSEPTAGMLQGTNLPIHSNYDKPTTSAKHIHYLTPVNCHGDCTNHTDGRQLDRQGSRCGDNYSPDDPNFFTTCEITKSIEDNCSNIKTLKVEIESINPTRKVLEVSTENSPQTCGQKIRTQRQNPLRSEVEESAGYVNKSKESANAQLEPTVCYSDSDLDSTYDLLNPIVLEQKGGNSSANFKIKVRGKATVKWTGDTETDRHFNVCPTFSSTAFPSTQLGQLVHVHHANHVTVHHSSCHMPTTPVTKNAGVSTDQWTKREHIFDNKVLVGRPPPLPARPDEYENNPSSPSYKDQQTSRRFTWFRKCLVCFLRPKSGHIKPASKKAPIEDPIYQDI